MREVFSDRCVQVWHDEASSLVRYVRTEAPYASTAELIAVHVLAGRAMDQLGRERHVLLADMRGAPLNNEPEFEKAAERARILVVKGFPRLAVLVRTAVGALQIKRHVREDEREILVTSDEAQALEFLLGKAEAEPSAAPARAKPSPSAPSRTTPPPSRPTPPPSRPAPPASRPVPTDGPFNHLRQGARRAGQR